jgi:outer membrane receptor protein involved in Fe transport
VVPNAITVVTAKQIEERGITRIDQLFRGDVPGLFAQNRGTQAQLGEVNMFSRGATGLGGAPASIKTYVDGVELADPRYLSQIDPRAIERIEIIAGPQASTIYGSNAINGVMQIFTKRGTSSRPQLTLTLLSGLVENNFSRARTPQHDYNAQLNGIEGHLSYNAGGSWNYMGPWTPAQQMARTSAFGGFRFERPAFHGRGTADVTFRRDLTHNRSRGGSRQRITGYIEDGWYNYGPEGPSRPTTSTLTGQTLGLVLGYAPANWWSQEVGIGLDASDIEGRSTARGYTNLDDTTLFLSQLHTHRRSLRYTMTAQIPATSMARATVTAGADGWQNVSSSLFVFPQTLTGSLLGYSSVYRQPGHNTGAFFQTQLGVRDQLFFTYGVRAEWSPNFGADVQPNYAPRYGIAYTRELGALTAKVRGSYGRSTRPPYLSAKVATPVVEPSWLQYTGPFDSQLANPDLGPEYQQGAEGGLEFYVGTKGSLIVTRYNQTVDGLISSAIVDSARTLMPCLGSCFAASFDSDGYGYYRQRQNLNIGSIRNQGWELQGSVNTGPFTTRGAYSWTKSRVIGMTPKYRSSFPARDYPGYQPGAAFASLPEHTWALGVTYARRQTTVALNVMGTGLIALLYPSSGDFYLRNLSGSIRLRQNRLNINPGQYFSANRGYALADLMMAHRVSSSVEGTLHVQNLTNRYTNDTDAAYATLGRQGRLGLRIRL